VVSTRRSGAGGGRIADQGALAAVVVIPARDEELLIGGCLTALAGQTLARERFEVHLVLDGCTDATEAIARERARELGVRLVVHREAGLGAGAARRLGMDAAARRLLGCGRPDGLIACTDADSRPAPDWLERQLCHLDAGAEAVAGLIELDAEMLPEAIARRRRRDASARLERVRASSPDAEHHHFAGASLGIRAGTYERVGGLEPLPALEDAAFAERLGAHGVPVRRAADVRVQTSARRVGRTSRGLAVDLAVSAWLEQRRYRAEDYPLELLRERKGSATVDVIVPTRECAQTVERVLQGTVMPLAREGIVERVVVVDAASGDGTAARARAAGALVLQQDELLAQFGPALGKGDAMWRALAATDSQIVCFLDGDTANPQPSQLAGLLGPLFADPELMLVKGAFERPLRTGAGALAHEGGRVTELMARPLVNLHEPRLAGFCQPLAGEFAARRAALEQVPFPVGYGVEIALLIDLLRAHGLDALAECDLGMRQNRHQPLRALGEMAYAVLAAVERRLPPRSPLGGHYLRPWEDGSVAHVPVAERPPLSSLLLHQSTSASSSPPPSSEPPSPPAGRRD
jgi:glucosyl-3-phosphoglycerate synthase